MHLAILADDVHRVMGHATARFTGLISWDALMGVAAGFAVHRLFGHIFWLFHGVYVQDCESSLTIRVSNYCYPVGAGGYLDTIGSIARRYADYGTTISAALVA